MAGCNQKSNRDPQLEVQDYEVEGAIKSLLVKGWVLEHEKEGGRTRRYAHQAEQQLGLGKAELALLTELLVRGPQAPGELKTRCERMAPMGAAEEVERRLVRARGAAGALRAAAGAAPARARGALAAPAGPAGADERRDGRPRARVAPAPRAPARRRELPRAPDPGRLRSPPRRLRHARAAARWSACATWWRRWSSACCELEQRLDRLEGR